MAAIAEAQEDSSLKVALSALYAAGYRLMPFSVVLIKRCPTFDAPTLEFT